ncbi:MAG: hypothetical protein P8X57_13515, partial [Cyclobacteriaceae bacterium]
KNLIILAFIALSHSILSQNLLHKERIPFPGMPENAYENGIKPGPEGRALYPGLFGHSAPIREVYSAQGDHFAGVENGNLYIRKNGDDEIRIISAPEDGWSWDVEAAKWDKDGRQLLMRQINTKELGTITLTDEDGNSRERTYSFMGEPLEKHQYYIVDVSNNRKTKIPHGLDMPFVHAVGWHLGKAYLLRADRMMHRLDLLEIDPAGEMRMIISERS